MFLFVYQYFFISFNIILIPEIFLQISIVDIVYNIFIKKNIYINLYK